MTVSRIRIVPVNLIDGTFLSRLGTCLEERFLYRCVVEPPLSVPRSALNSVRGQMFAHALSAKILSAYPDGNISLGVTDFDLYKSSQRFVFGYSDERQRIAVISVHRFKGEFYGEDGDANKLFQRAVKEAVHQLGRTLRLGHCFNARCAMYSSNSIFETDNKWSHFCDSCDRRCRARN